MDVFAPGVKIWATTPLNTYEFLQGTSMASPEVAGVAAMIRSYYPNLTAKQVRQILMDSGLSITLKLYWLAKIKYRFFHKYFKIRENGKYV